MADHQISPFSNNLSVPLPARLVVFSPHPDDASISCGALLASCARTGADVEVVLMTDGSEAHLPESVLTEHGWTPSMSPEQTRALRGRIRMTESQEESRRLGFAPGVVRLLRRQKWFTAHRTPLAHLHPDLSLREVERFKPGPVTPEAVEEVIDILTRTDEDRTMCAVPHPDDRLQMHRITTALFAEALLSERIGGSFPDILLYECLSTESMMWRAGRLACHEFGAELMEMKRWAICAHHSMRERRRLLGGYSNPGSEFYDTIVQRKNAEDARTCNGAFAERFVWLRQPSKTELTDLIRSSGVQAIG